MELSGQSQRWQGQRSAYSWEQSALEHVKAQMPDAEPYRAWQTFTFTTDQGHVREVDLLIATPGGLFLVEIKSHPGTAGNHRSTWMFRDGDKNRTFENPLHFTDLKAKELKTQLQRAARKLRINEPVPRIEAVVFLSAEDLKSRLDEFQSQRVYGRDKLENSTGLDGIWTGFLNQPPASERNRVTPTISKQLPKLMQEIGITRLHRIGRVGPYELSEKSYDSGPTWEDYLAVNPSLPADYPRRVRVFLTERTATDEDKKSVQRAARRAPRVPGTAGPPLDTIHELERKQVALLEADLKPTGLASDRLKVEWRAAKSADRTAATFESWLGERVTQVAVA
jgi:Nuclease-related domain